MLKIGSDQENTNSPSKPNTNKDFMRQLSVQELFDGTCYMQTQVVFFLYFYQNILTLLSTLIKNQESLSLDLQ